MIRCPFCRSDPFHWVHNGCGMEAVAVTCCDLGADLWSRDARRSRAAARVRDDMQSFSPRRKARAMTVLRDAGIRPVSRSERRANARDVGGASHG